MSSSKSALERTISTYNKGSRVIRPSAYELSLISDESPSLRLESNSGLLEGGFITLESGSSVEKSGGGITLLTGTTDQTLTYRSGDITLRTGDSNNSGYIWVQSGQFPNADYPDPSSGEVHIVGKSRLSLRSGEDIIIAPMPYNTYSSTSGGNVIVRGQEDTFGANPGYVRIRGGDQASNGSNSNRAGAVYLEAGQANSGVEGSDTWGGDISLTSYGYGRIISDAYSVSSVARGIYSVTTTTRDSNDDSAFIYLSTGDGADGTSTSGDISIKTGAVFGSPTGSDNCDSGDVVIQTSGSYDGVSGSITLTTGASVEGVVGDIEITTGDLTSPNGTAGSVVLEGGTGSNSALPGTVNIIGGGVTSIDWLNVGGNSFNGGDVTISGGDIDEINEIGKIGAGGSVWLKGGDGGVASNGGVSIRGAVYVSEAHSFNVDTDQSSTFNIGTTFQLEAGQVNIGATSFQYDARVFTTNEGNVHLDADGEVEINSTSVATNAENLLLAIGSDSILKTLGISLLGTGTVTFTIPDDYHVVRVPLFFGNFTINSGGSLEIEIGRNSSGNTALYPEIVETYSGIRPLTGSTLNYPNVKVLTTISTDSNQLEVDSSPYLVTTPVNYSGYYYLDLRYVEDTVHAGTEGIINQSGAVDIDVKLHYLVFA